MTIHVVIKDDWSLEMIEIMATELNWEWVKTVVESEKIPFQEVWRTPSGSLVYYVEDPWIGIRYFQIDDESEAALLNTIFESIPTFARAELIDFAKKAEGQGLKSLAIRRLLVGTGYSPGEDVVSAAERFFLDADPIVRRDAVVATGFASWPAFRSIVEKLAKKESDPEVIEACQLILDGWPSTKP